MSVSKISFVIKSLLVLMVLVPGTAVRGQTWEYKDSGTTFLLYDLAIPDGQSTIAYAAGAQFTSNSPGIIIKTEDGGDTWNTVYPTAGTIDGIEKIAFIDENTGYAVGYDLFVKTTDGGATWTDIVVANDVWVYKSLTFYNSNIGIVTVLTNSSGFEVYTTVDGGLSWNPITSSANMPSFAVDYGNASILYAVGANETISTSINGGDTWSILQTGTPTFYYLEVEFKDEFNGLIAGEDGQLMTTHDGGTTWDMFSTGYHNFYGLRYKGNELYAAGTDQDVYHSTDNGASWTMVHDGPNVATFYDIEYFDDDSFLICGSQGQILKYTPPPLSSNDIQDAKLVQTYDPVTAVLTLRASQPITKFEIYSIDGKLVYNGENNSENLTADLSSTADGYYLLRLQIRNAIVSKRFIKY